jgi:hypothetical protein
MKQLCRTAAFLALLGAPAFADLQLVRKSHTDAYKSFGKDVPAKDAQSTIWFAKDRLHIESEGMNAIVRLDQKKLILLDSKEKTWTAIDLPFDMKKYLPPEMAGMAEQMMGAQALQAKVEAKDETKKFGEWNARRFEITLSQRGNVVSKEIVFASKDLKADPQAFAEMYSAMMSMAPENKLLAVELKKIEGVPVHSEKSQTIGNAEVKTTEDLVSATEKDPPAGTYEAPADYKEQPFDPMKGKLGPAGKHIGPGGK